VDLQTHVDLKKNRIDNQMLFVKSYPKGQNFISYN